MGIKQKIKNYPRAYNLLLFILNSVDYFNRRFRHYFPRYIPNAYWKKRIEVVKASPDNERFAHFPDSGKIFHDYQLMHNGLKIALGSYYDYGNTLLLQENKGVHEPQEEYAFGEVIRSMPVGASILELGSYWAFYSMWFASAVPQAQCFMVEPDPHKMNFGKLNFKLNQLTGKFLLGFITDHTNDVPNIPFFSVDELIKRNNINFLHLLHSDIQGYELKMLQGASQSLANKNIGYLFISTHSNELHYACISELKKSGYVIVCEADLDASYAVDGLIVAKLPGIEGPDSLTISKRG